MKTKKPFDFRRVTYRLCDHTRYDTSIDWFGNTIEVRSALEPPDGVRFHELLEAPIIRKDTMIELGERRERYRFGKWQWT
jgi:hypothetical protein